MNVTRRDFVNYGYRRPDRAPVDLRARIVAR